MSIASEIIRIQAAKSSLKSAINAKGGALTTELLDDYAAAVSALPESSGTTDLSFVTAGSGDILSGKVGVDVDGNPVEGSIQTVTAVLTENKVTVPAGYIAAEQILTVSEMAVPAVSGNIVTVGKGYCAAEKEITVGTAKAAETITPGTADRTISAGTYLSGALTVRGDANLLAENIAEGVTIFGISGTLSCSQATDLSFVTAAPEDILAGKVGVDSAGNPVTGTIPAVTASVVDNMVSIPAGYVAAEQTLTVGTAKSAETITPGTSDQTVAAGTYLTGELTVKGDTGLRAENIRSGRKIFGVAGTFIGTGTGSGSMDFYKCAAVYGPREVTRIRVEGAGTTAVNGDYEKTGLTTESGGEVWKHMTADYYYFDRYDTWCIADNYETYTDMCLYYSYGDGWSLGYEGGAAEPAPTVSEVNVTLDADVPKTWDGYKAVLTEDGYIFEEAPTAGLSYGSAFTPETKSIYSADCAIAVKYLYSNFPRDYLFFDALNSADGWTFSGAEVVQDGSRNVFQTSGGSSHAVLNVDPGVPLASSPRTMSHWFKRTADCSSSWCGIGYGKSGNNSRFTWGLRGNYSIITLWGDDNFQTQNGLINDDEWHHFLTTYDGVDKVVQYLDGKKIWEWSTGTTSTAWQYIHVGDPWESYACNGRFADFYIYDRVLRDYEIQQLFEAKTVGE